MEIVSQVVEVLKMIATIKENLGSRGKILKTVECRLVNAKKVLDKAKNQRIGSSSLHNLQEGVKLGRQICEDLNNKVGRVKHALGFKDTDIEEFRKTMDSAMVDLNSIIQSGGDKGSTTMETKASSYSVPSTTMSKKTSPTSPKSAAKEMKSDFLTLLISESEPCPRDRTHTFKYCQPYVKMNTGYVCNLCARSYPISAKSYHCKCNYDVCDTCHAMLQSQSEGSYSSAQSSSRTQSSSPQCRLGKTHVFKYCQPYAKSHNKGFGCDGCGGSFPSSAKSHHCDCNYDLCDGCWALQ